MNKDKIQAIEARASAATKGPWQWYGNTKFGDCHLATKTGGRVFVMGFSRWKMTSAQPEFQLRFDNGDGIMCKLSDLTDPGLGLPQGMGPVFEAPHRQDFVGIAHPDAEFIAHSRQDVDDLLEDNRRLREQNTSLRCMVGDLCTRLARVSPETWDTVAHDINEECDRILSLDREDAC